MNAYRKPFRMAALCGVSALALASFPATAEDIVLLPGITVFSTVDFPTQPGVTQLFRDSIEEVMAKHCSSTEKWEETQKKLEKDYADWLKKKDHTGKITETSMLIQFIAERKAKIAKDNGVLSVGTVKPPDEKKRRKYKSLGRNRNG